ncbi:hypothetical protein OKE80_01330 [Riemerella anatipestifer]|uniref:TaqI-like C-terminal specificity domain-containing protein n=1 Tax=Riemerella anatipestifer TaxID=34085 RepID=UPI001C86862A|nr:TaqI-like C-terminal specificity domain-containing protein [Riemerella anatipestifer]MCO7318000.1 hypothetical protein [Riemerella anatipestifer]MCQ4154158.1 hypothetical protein [Riemerella anatipestifer]MCQ4180216.1 hypothetical protein [Riemerella anatipestifer]MCW0473473.1 hypothetical protein [Riemerella anatipestifer]MDR7774269.1 TaqI-like C-terminal specificity domain-containing protein [Riemerella anatipestifer]
MKDWNINIYRGILTGYNEAFIIDGKKKDELIAEDPKSAEIIRPILRGRDIKRYSYDFADLWLINTHNGIKEKGIKPINIDNYPAVKAHLDNYYPQLEKRADKGETPYNLRNCAYMEDFSRPKVIYPNMTKFLPFVYDGKGFLTNQKCFIITGSKVEFLTAFLNSSLFKYCFKDDFPELQGGTRELSKIFFDKITVMQISEETNLQFKKIIDDIQQMKENGESTKELELIIDTLLFNLYNLKEEEIKEIGFIEIL